MADGTGSGKREDGVDQPPKIEDARASLLRVLHENEELESELTRIREGNLRAARILTHPVPQLQPRDTLQHASSDPAVATAARRDPLPPQPPPPPPQRDPPKRPRPDDE